MRKISIFRSFFVFLQKINKTFETIRRQIETSSSLGDERHRTELDELRRRLTTIVERQKEKENRIRPILVTQEENRQTIEFSSEWLKKTVEYFRKISQQPVSIQYDQTANRLKSLFDEIRTKFDEISQLEPPMSDEQNRTNLIEEFRLTTESIEQTIDQREKTMKNAEIFDENLVKIQQNLKNLRNNVEKYRLATNSPDDLQVRSENLFDFTRKRRCPCFFVEFQRTFKS